ncbi:hypothetical protein HIM_02708 [Hirsutella minnesotensis 3608]|nr:hypothetical protein HIM_02708 [Hirsutella minnesotensis 3608]
METISDVYNLLRDAVMGQRGYAYSAIPISARRSARNARRHAQGLGSRLRRLLMVLAGAGLLLTVLALAAIYSRGSADEERCVDSGHCPVPSPRTWGQYSPFFSVPSEIVATTPAECRLTFGLVLSRHGARYPTLGKAKAYRAMLERVRSLVKDYGSGFEFVEHFVLDDESDRLTSFGEAQMVDSGASFLHRYRDLALDRDPFIRASGSDRVVMSSHNFTQGFFKGQGKSASDAIARILVLPEKTRFNNSLEHGSCPAFEDGPASEVGWDKQDVWRRRWATPIQQRLNEKLPGANLTLEETVFMMDLCPYSSVVTANSTGSDFCRLFSRHEWHGYDYLQSLGKWYGYGNGNPLGSTQGVGYVNELIARLTGQEVRDGTTTNSTLDSSPETFPLDRKLYADFTHDNTMTTVYAALGLYNETRTLPIGHRLPPMLTHGYSAAWTVPFAGRMYVEKMRCDGDEEELVRILVNDRVVPLQGCEADELGRCRLGDFVEGLSFARAGGSWGTCFA